MLGHFHKLLEAFRARWFTHLSLQSITQIQAVQNYLPIRFSTTPSYNRYLQIRNLEIVSQCRTKFYTKIDIRYEIAMNLCMGSNDIF